MPSNNHGFAPWECGRANCFDYHCARCGHHCGAQGDMLGGFIYKGEFFRFAPDRTTKEFEIAFSCDEAEFTGLMRKYYGGEAWIEAAIEAQRDRFRPDARATAAAKPDTRPCIYMIGRHRCSHPEDVPLHASAEGCTADGGRCDVPHAHHRYVPPNS